MLSRQLLRKNSDILLPCAFAAAVIGGMWGIALTRLEEARAKELSIAEQNVTSIVHALDAHTARTLDAADRAVRFLVYEYGLNGSRLDMPTMEAAGIIASEVFHLFSVVDARGDVILSSQPFEKVNLADREHIRVHMAADTGHAFISKPVLGRVSRKWSIQLTRRISKPDNSFGGAVVASLNPYYFMRLYDSVRVGSQGMLALIGKDGVIRALRTGSGDAMGKDVSASPLFQSMRDAPAGTLRGRSTVDAIDRIWAYRQVEGYPLFVVAGVAVEEELKSFDAMRHQIFLVAAVSTLAVLVFTAVLILLIKRLTLRREQAIMASRAKTQFLSNMSHELRTPLHGILGYAELLREDLANEEHRSFANHIHDSGMHLLSLVNSLLQVGRIEGGEIELDFSTENIRDCLAQAIHAHGSSAAAKGIELVLDVSPEVPGTMLCDRMKFLQVLNNLLHNAVKFTDKGKIKLNASADDRQLWITVSDTGRGIDPAHQRTVFEKFVQVDPAGGVNAGSGLGLSIVRRLVELMGGRISLQSEPGVGSSFTFTMPFEPAPPADTGSP